MTDSPQRAALARALDRWNAGDLDGYFALYDPSVLLHGYTPQPLDYGGARGFYDAIWASFPSSVLEFHDVLETGDRITIRFTMTGRHDGGFMGVPPTGRTVTLPGITILRFDGERCAERWSCADMLGLLVQLGAIPAPA
jgi:predicted ester cyclase